MKSKFMYVFGILIASVFACGGCGGGDYRAYDGPKLSEDKVAIVHYPKGSEIAYYVAGADGQMFGKLKKEVAFRPGQHTLVVFAQHRKPVTGMIPVLARKTVEKHSDDSISVLATLSEGHKYIIKTRNYEKPIGSKLLFKDIYVVDTASDEVVGEGHYKRTGTTREGGRIKWWSPVK